MKNRKHATLVLPSNNKTNDVMPAKKKKEQNIK